MATGFEAAAFLLGGITLGGKITDKYRVISVEGLNGLPFNFKTTKNSDAQSSYLESATAQPRMITFVFETDNDPVERELLMQIFNPFTTDILNAYWNGVAKYIHYVPYPIKIDQTTTYSKMVCTLDLYCVEPFWNSPDDVTPDTTEARTLELPTTKDEPTRYLHTIDFGVTNYGDVPLPFKVAFENNGASSCLNPTVQLIYNPGDEPMMRANTDVWYDDYDEVGSIVEFSTYPDDLHVVNESWMGTEDLEKSLDINHEYFMCPRGYHTIRCTVETSDSSQIGIIFSGSARYLGL